MDQLQRNFKNLLGRFLLQINDGGQQWDWFQGEAAKSVFYYDNQLAGQDRLDRLWKLLQEIEKELK